MRSSYSACSPSWRTAKCKPSAIRIASSCRDKMRPCFPNFFQLFLFELPWVAINRLVRANALEFCRGSVQLESDLPSMVGKNVNFPDSWLGQACQRMQAQSLCPRIALQQGQCLFGCPDKVRRQASHLRPKPIRVREALNADFLCQDPANMASNKSSTESKVCPVVGCNTASCVAIHSRNTSTVSCRECMAAMKAS